MVFDVHHHDFPGRPLGRATTYLPPIVHKAALLDQIRSSWTSKAAWCASRKEWVSGYFGLSTHLASLGLASSVAQPMVKTENWAPLPWPIALQSPPSFILITPPLAAGHLPSLGHKSQSRAQDGGRHSTVVSKERMAINRGYKNVI